MISVVINRFYWVRLVVCVGLLCLLTTAAPAYAADADLNIPLGSAYTGKKCIITVGDFAVQVSGAPQEIGDGLREMLQTALFESNHFTLVDRLDIQGISAEKLLSDSFMADPDSILAQGQMLPAELLFYGTVTTLEGGGKGLRLKIPWLPLHFGGVYYKARVVIDLRAVDAASGQVIAATQASSSAVSGEGDFGTAFGGIDLPVELEIFKNTPLELCIRDCIYRSVIQLCIVIPDKYFQH